MFDAAGEVAIRVQKYAEEFSISVELAQIIAKRFPEYNNARAFLMPRVDLLNDPALMPDVDDACQEIASAIKNKENILIYTHDDPDGYTSAAIMYKTLLDIRHGSKPDIYVYPIVREKDGYILNEDVLKGYLEKGVKTVITVDFGISNEENFVKATNLGLKLVVCDHHETMISSFPIPAVDPKRSDSNYPFRDLAGVGVTFKFCQALYAKLLGLKMQDFYQLKYEFFALAMIGTIADRVMALHENRVFCIEGIRAIRESNAPWARYLNKQGEMAFGMVNADVIPALQAAASVDPNLGVNFFLSRDVDEAHDFFSRLKKAEEIRRAGVENLFAEANAAAKVFPQVVVSVIPLDQPVVTTPGADPLPAGKCIVMQNYLGVVASKLRDRFQKTTVTIGIKNGKCHGELRTTGVDLYKLLSSMRGLFLDFGGHEKAAGFSMHEEHLDRFISGLNQYLEQHKAGFKKKPVVPETLLDKSQMRLLEPLMPFGDGNPAPVLTNGVELYTIDNKLNIIELGIWQT